MEGEKRGRIELGMERMQERNDGDTGEHKHREMNQGNQTFHSKKMLLSLYIFSFIEQEKSEIE